MNLDEQRKMVIVESATRRTIPGGMPLTSKQKYSIASTLATSSLESTISQIQNFGSFIGDSLVESAIDFATQIDMYYVKRNGYIPKQVLKIIDNGD